MVQVYVVYNPYRLATSIEINGNPIEVDSPLYKYVRNRRLQEWVGDFPDKLKETANSLEFENTYLEMSHFMGWMLIGMILRWHSSRLMSCRNLRN